MMPGRLRTGLYAAAALAAGLLLRLWFVAHAGRVDGDSLIYGTIARNWVQQGVYGFMASPNPAHPGPLPTLIRLPGYPLFLAACFRIFGANLYTSVMYLQCGIDLLTCLLVSALAGRLFGRRAAMAALWLSALCPFTATYTAAPLTEILTLATIALTMYGVERWRDAGAGFNRWLWLTTAAMAYSLLLRPEQGLLAATFIPAMLWIEWRPSAHFNQQPSLQPSRIQLRRLLPALVCGICVLLPLVPWTARNWHTFHIVQPLAPRSATDPGEDIPSGFYRWYRTWGIDFASTEEVYWNYDNAAVEIEDLPNRAFDSSGQYKQTSDLLADYNKTYNASPAFDARFEALAEQRIQNDPLRYYVALPVARLLNMLFRPRAEMVAIPLEWWKWREHPRTTMIATALAALNLAYFVLGGIGLWMWYRRGWGPQQALAWAMIAFVLLRCALLLTLDNSETRYTLEFFPLLILWASTIFTHPEKFTSQPQPQP